MPLESDSRFGVMFKKIKLGWAMRKLWCVLGFLILFVSSVKAQQNQTGQIFGTVTDPSGALMPGVKVTLSGPAILQPQVVTTTAAGSYQFPGIPIGTYSVQFEATGYRLSLRQDIRVDIGFNAQVNAQLQLASVSQTIEVSGAAPVVDTQSTAQNTELDQQNLQELPVARSFFNEVELSGGVAESAKDVGGAQNLNQPSFVALGASAGQNRYFYEGADIAPAGGGNAMWVDFNSVQEMQVVDGGADASVQTSGAMINMVVKSGSNNFHGSFHDYEEGQSFEADNIGSGTFRRALASAQPEASAGNPLTHFRDIGADVGGPIIKNKLWFWGDWGDNGVWVGADHVYQTTSDCSGITNATQLNFSWGKVRSCEVSFPTFIRAYVFKIGYTPFHNNTLTFTNEYSNKEVYYNGLTPLVDITATRPQNASCGSHWHWDGIADEGVFKPPFLWDCGWPSLWKWDDQQIVNDHLVLDFAFIHFAKRNEFALQPPALGVAIQQEQSSGAIRTSNTLVSEFQPMNNIHFSGNYFMPGKFFGNHTFKFGYNWIRFENYMEDNAGGFNSEVEEIYSSGAGAPYSVPFAVEFFRPGFFDAFLHEQNIYVQDTVQRNRWAFNLGIRWDHQTDTEKGFNIPASPFEGQATGAAGNPAFNWLPAISYPGAQGGVAWNTFAPRLGVTYDLFGNGKTVLKASFGQYFDQRIAGQLADTYDTVEKNTAQSFIEFPWGGATQNGLPVLNGPIVNGKNTGVNAPAWVTGPAPTPTPWIATGNNYNPLNPGNLSSSNSVDPNVKDPKTNEITAGVSQEIGPGFGITVTYTYRRYSDFLWNHLNGITSADYVPCQTPTAANPTTTCEGTQYFYNTPGKQSFVCPTTVAPERPTECPSVTFYAPNTTTPTSYTVTNQPGYHISYQGLQINARKVMTKTWMMNAVVTIQSTRQYWAGPNSYQDPTNIAIENGAEFAPSSSPGGGFPINVPVNARWNARVGGLYRLPWWGINLGATDDVSQGYPILSAITVASRPFGAGAATVPGPSNGGTIQSGVLIHAPGTQRFNSVQNLAIRVDKTFTFKERFRIQPSLDIYNLFNSNTILGQQPNQNSANANFIDYALSPRVARIGIMASF